MGTITVRFTAAQARVIHAALSMVENDTDWIDLLGGPAAMIALVRGHERLMEEIEANA